MEVVNAVPVEVIPTSVWLIPALFTLIVYGIGQGLVKMFINDASPAKFCLFFVVAKVLLNMGYFLTHEHPDPFSADSSSFMMFGILAYILDGAGWILYFQSIVFGPITIVGTLSAAYPAITILMAKFFLSEQLMNVQYVGVFFVIACCLGLSYSPSNPNETEEDKKITSNKWIPFAFFALLMWSSAQTLMKYAYSLPNSNEVNMLVFNTIGGALTLGIYGVLYGIKGQKNSFSEFGKSFLPMGMMAAGDIGFIIASSKGPISVISPLTGAYPLVTLLFAAVVLKEKIIKFHWLCIFILLFGIFLSSAEKEIIVKYLSFLAFLT